MIVMGMLATLQWDALDVDERDAFILGPLPIRPRQVVLAKLAAIVGFAADALVVLNAVPSVLYQLMLATPFFLPASRVLQLAIVHAVVTTAAGVTSFSTVVALREILLALLPRGTFRPIAGLVQATLVLMFVTALLLLPTVSVSAADRSAAPPTVLRTLPPLWFLGAYEALAGDVIVSVPSQYWDPDVIRSDATHKAAYRRIAAEFWASQWLAWRAQALSFIIAVTAWLWNSRNSAAVAAARSRTAAFGRFEWLLPRRAAARAGFAFAIRTITRSGPHRLIVGACFAVAMAIAAVATRGASALALDVRGHSVPLGWLSAEFIVVAISALAARHLVRIPAALDASWTFEAIPARHRRFRVWHQESAVLGSGSAGTRHCRCPFTCCCSAPGRPYTPRSARWRP